MFEWYAELPKWLKFGVAVLLLSLSGGLWAMEEFWAWGWGAGFVLLLAAFCIND